jgi:hypothetical protein
MEHSKIDGSIKESIDNLTEEDLKQLLAGFNLITKILHSKNYENCRDCTRKKLTEKMIKGREGRWQLKKIERVIYVNSNR